MCCFLVKQNCTLMPVSTAMLLSVMIHQWGLEGSWGLQQNQTDFVPCIHYWVITGPLLLKAWPASQHPQVFSDSLTPPWTSCSPAGWRGWCCVTCGRLQPATLPNALMDRHCSWSFLAQTPDARTDSLTRSPPGFRHFEAIIKLTRHLEMGTTAASEKHYHFLF